MTIEKAAALAIMQKPCRMPFELFVYWTDELEKRIQSEIFLTPAEEIRCHGMAGKDEELLAPKPYDGIYVSWLLCQIDWYNQEMEKYQYSMQRFTEQWTRFTKWWMDRHLPANGEESERL